MRILIFGSNGMLGRELSRNLGKNYEIISSERKKLDLDNVDKIESYILEYAPNIVINAAAIVDINFCEQNKIYSYKINTIAVLKMALACNIINAKFVQISTDHFYVNNSDKKHKEDDYITIMNNYAYTKFIAEAYSFLAKNHLVIRTNIVGFKNINQESSFLDWAIKKIINYQQMKLFRDYYSSPIDIYNFCMIINKALSKNLTGIYNISSSDVISKADFIVMLSKKFGINLNNPIILNISENYNKDFVARATTNGLDVTKIECDLDIKMPKSLQVIEKIYEVYNEKFA